MSEEKDKKWHATVRYLNILANLANIGIVLHIVLTLLPILLPLAILGKCAYVISQFTTLANIITAGMDPFIYVCKGLNRLIRLRGRNQYEVTFIEERYGTHENQNAADVISSILFGIAITAFILSHFFFPFLSSIAWVAGLVGTGINIFFDETFPAKKAEEAHKTIQDPTEAQAANEYYKDHYYESLFYSLLLFSLFVFLPCKSLAQSHCLPAITESIFKAIAAVGSALVVALNILRVSGNLPCCSAYQKLPGLEKSNRSPALSSMAHMIPQLSFTPPSSRRPQPIPSAFDDNFTELGTRSFPSSFLQPLSRRPQDPIPGRIRRNTI